MNVQRLILNVIILGLVHIELTAENQAVIESEAYQKSVQDNICEGDALCSNEGSNFASISATGDSSVDSDSKQDLQQYNDCEGVLHSVQSLELQVVELTT